MPTNGSTGERKKPPPVVRTPETANTKKVREYCITHRKESQMLRLKMKFKNATKTCYRFEQRDVGPESENRESEE